MRFKIRQRSSPPPNPSSAREDIEGRIRPSERVLRKRRARAELEAIRRRIAVSLGELSKLRDAFAPYLRAYQGTLDGRGLELEMNWDHDSDSESAALVLHPRRLLGAWARWRLNRKHRTPWLALYYFSQAHESSRVRVSYAGGGVFSTSTQAWMPAISGLTKAQWSRGSSGEANREEVLEVLKQALADHVRDRRAGWFRRLLRVALK